MPALETLKQFLDHIFNGRTDQALGLVDPAAEFVAGPATGMSSVPLYGRYAGHDGARTLFEHFGTCFEPGEFDVHGTVAQGDTAVMFGRLRHRVRVTGRDFNSDWALVARVRDGRLLHYQFHEDTAALAAALN